MASGIRFPGGPRCSAPFALLQAERKAQEAKELEEAALLAQLSEINGLPYEPQKDGFVFSNARITAFIDRNHRLRHAATIIPAASAAASSSNHLNSC
jgi:hypothetical protein